MLIIKNAKYDVFQFAPIIINCRSYSKLLDVTLKLTNNGLKLDVSYLESDIIGEKDLFEKKFHFIIKKKNETIENEFTFLKVVELLISDTVERYYIFYRVDCSGEENRQNKLDDLGI